MKKSIIAAMVLVIAVCMAGVGFAKDVPAASATTAAAQAQVVKGKIESINTASSQITIKEASGTELTVSVSASEIASVKKGDEVKVTLKADGTTASKVKVVKDSHKISKSKK